MSEHALEMALESGERASCVSAGQTALYRHFNADGELLYVGISLNHVARLAQHRMSAPWFSQIATITVVWYETRAAAVEAERAVIHTEKPLHNIAHMPGQAKADLAAMIKGHPLERFVGPDGLLDEEAMHMDSEEAACIASRL